MPQEAEGCRIAHVSSTQTNPAPAGFFIAKSNMTHAREKREGACGTVTKRTVASRKVCSYYKNQYGLIREGAVAQFRVRLTELVYHDIVENSRVLR